MSSREVCSRPADAYCYLITYSDENASDRLQSGQGWNVANGDNELACCSNYFDGRRGWHYDLEIES